MNPEDCKHCADKALLCASPEVGYIHCVLRFSDRCRAFERKGETMQKFWMLLVDDHTYASHKHPTIEGAIEEAARLLNLYANQGKGVTLLEAVDYGRLGNRPVTYPVVWEQGREHVYKFPEDYPEDYTGDPFKDFGE